MEIRNIAIIAHVDHGKTTLTDSILRHTGAVTAKEDRERLMDSNALEQEKGITILAKNTSVKYKGTRINIVDTPGHADFGGEVERVLSMTDCTLLLIDAFDGPMPQTRFVLGKSLQLGHKPIVVVNKVDREGARPGYSVDKVFDLFSDLGATEEQLDFPIIYASGKQGWAVNDLSEVPGVNIEPLLDKVLSHVPPVKIETGKPLQFQVTALDYNEYVGRIAIGKIYQGTMKKGADVTLAKTNGTTANYKITKLYGYEGLTRYEIDEAGSGDIVAMAGIPDVFIGDTVCDLGNPLPLPAIQVEEPTVSMFFMVNNSPFAGKEGKFVTTRNLRERLDRELETNVALRLEETEDKDRFKILGRGELHLSILIENMRREGYELQVSRPEVIIKQNELGEKIEPYETLVMDLPDQYTGACIQELNRRKGELTGMDAHTSGITRVEYIIPTRGLIGFRGHFISETRGEGVMSSRFLRFDKYKGEIPGRKNGALISMDSGESTAYALWKVQERGELFIEPQVAVYPGMILGMNSRDSDLEVNPVREKKLTNVRASGSDEAIRLVPPKKLTLEQSIEFLDDDELLEVTPQSLRLRKKVLDASMRKRSSSGR
ncbi:translational GTPase TypA [Leptospira sp. 2 VSF19]|uniref:Large ribosomal subunit assembly factor BipA n=1 Tax=Leptospira soteropolitanensis TaxID=2950025 RepID=A0AAW5VG58_9LEPT|nr:translational GTPase TypA [Leptospira soteropolitanensis]MCW7492115.1 translational GTPase TypA [Leptospira soteropolitanensis]MCW7499697.1 translational GTPase TypA [Leptospira soteropolitanensis]MCW7521948.1 translational GTPase TypA [Leptospira soteropolitanensis]MCW7525802.1 translational GTPase TypA [Leptospira soteropolitanensis]MCW7530084.1 translational GTPase TypA [Leptospira soteropolitanensis]